MEERQEEREKEGGELEERTEERTEEGTEEREERIEDTEESLEVTEEACEEDERCEENQSAIQQPREPGFVLHSLTAKKIANLISKLNFYKLIPYPMDNC